MMNNMQNMFEKMMKQDDSQMAKMMQNIPMMENMPMMKEMYQSMLQNGFDMNSCFGTESESSNRSGIKTEVDVLFTEWLSQIKEEIEQYQKTNPEATIRELSQYFKLSEESIEYIIKSMTDPKTNKSANPDYSVLKIKKTMNSCSLCEDYVHKNKQKPIVVASCEGACLRGEISRKIANQLCHTVAPDKTVRLCLGSALTKEAGQRSLVDHADKLLVLEGCPVDCASRMLCGLSDNIHPEIIRTDIMADFDKSLFGIDEMPEEEINKLAYQVACKIAEKL